MVPGSWVLGGTVGGQDAGTEADVRRVAARHGEARLVQVTGRDKRSAPAFPRRNAYNVRSSWVRHPLSTITI